jgi:REP element-mobilizing transposase RayT
MADNDTDTEKRTAPAEEQPRPHRRPFAFERTNERLPEVEEDYRSSKVPAGEEHGEVVFEPVERQPYIISYVCVLIPRFDSHFLRGDVVAFLHQWLQNLALSFTWKLEWTDIQLQYLQWMLSVPVTVPPASFIRVIRQQTSRQILAEFPHYTKENLSRDFWAPGHLISVGRRPHPLDTINEFIRLTRQQQGIYPPSR